MALYRSERHEPLAGGDWSEARARDAITRIAADAHRAFTDEGLWPIHPLDRSDERPSDCLKPLYHGAAGVIWALNHLAGAGAVPAGRDYRPALDTLIRRNRDDLDRYAAVAAYMGGEQAAFLTGETGILLLQAVLAPTASLPQRLHAAVAATVGDTRGLVWGGAGAMLAALFLHERTGDARWKALYLDHVEALWDRWAYDHAAGCWLWTQDLYGVVEKRLGALHGFMANAFAIIRGRALLPARRLNEALGRIAETVCATALEDSGWVNWPASAGSTTAPLFVQHCNGAPGFITVMAALSGGADSRVDALLLKAGELVWAAGPTVKHPSLCHGAAGSGHALLKLFQRTGDQRWLDRARAFAMHAIDRCDAALGRYGQRKFSLWTGDLGVAVFLWDAVAGQARFPTLDVF